jgi:(1->4)-alpha-D-glucan 1-alpha-D-glucosylmutase
VDDLDREAVTSAGIEGELADALLLRSRSAVLDEFVVRFQQTSPPVTAKGVEDTAFYRHLRLLALNEVGGDPARFGLSVEEFHAANAARFARFPRGLLVTQTHDTKRSGDVRARIGALAGMAAEWRDAVARWRELAAGLEPPDPHASVPPPADPGRRLADLRRAAGGLRREGAARGQAAHELGRARTTPTRTR